MDDLHEYVEQCCIGALHVDNVAATVQFAEEHACIKVYDACVEFMVKHYKELLSQDSFLEKLTIGTCRRVLKAIATSPTVPLGSLGELEEEGPSPLTKKRSIPRRSWYEVVG